VKHTAEEMMTVAAARELRDGQTVFVGIDLPSRAANLARRLHAPGLVLVYESGTIDTRPDELPLSIGDGVLTEHALTVEWLAGRARGQDEDGLSGPLRLRRRPRSPRGRPAPSRPAGRRSTRP